MVVGLEDDPDIVDLISNLEFLAFLEASEWYL
jgi:hypothetical protein